jgi:hypothetical protein
MKIGLDLVNWKRVPSDSTIHVAGTNIKKVLITVDVSAADLLLAKTLGCDAVIAHHPLGISALTFSKVFSRHVEFMTQEGVPKRKAWSAVQELKKKFDLRAHASIYDEVVDAARMLKMPLVNIHQPCDEYMRTAILKKLNSGRTRYISDIIRSVEEIPEFRNASTRINLVHGNLRNETGRWILVLAAGTNGGYPIAKLYYEYGIFTVIYLHIDHNDAKKIHDEKLKGNLIVLGHLAGDSIGLNALADRLEGLGVETMKLGLVPRSL